MADSFSSSLRVRLQATGSNTNTWGGLLNSAALQLLEDAIAGLIPITVASAAVTLTSNNGATDQARYAMLKLTGTPGADRTIIVPPVPKKYLVWNATDTKQTIKTPSGAGVEIAVGVATQVFCDGTDVRAIQSAATGAVAEAVNAQNLGGFAAAVYARLDVANSFQKGVRWAFKELVDGSTVTMDVADTKNHHVVLAGNRTLAVANAADGAEFDLWIQQDAGGGHTITWPADFTFEGGATPVLSTSAGALDRFEGKYHAEIGKWVVRPGGRTGAGGSVALTVSVGGSNIRLHDLVGRPGGIVTVDVAFDRGVVITSLSPAAPALDLRGFATGSTVRIVNRGRILGCGGDGGAGGGVNSAGDDFTFKAKVGRNGGVAVMGPGSGITCQIDNGDGYIWGGGGGGGGGGATAANGSQVAGGGGGGGAPFGRGGDGASAGGTSQSTGNPGADASLDTAGNGGTGGAAVGSGNGGTGGQGGAPGANGNAGTGPTGSSYTAPAGAGGTAGKAIEQNGGTVTVLSGAGSPNILGAVS